MFCKETLTFADEPYASLHPQTSREEEVANDVEFASFLRKRGELIVAPDPAGSRRPGSAPWLIRNLVSTTLLILHAATAPTRGVGVVPYLPPRATVATRATLRAGPSPCRGGFIRA